MSNDDRPLSPHLSIYRWPVTMTVSILHRATGIAMSIGFLALATWLFDAALGSSSYDKFLAVATSPVGQLLLVGWSFAFFFHLANGIRHLVWDSGRGLQKGSATRSAWFVIGFAVLTTALFWTLVWGTPS